MNQPQIINHTSIDSSCTTQLPDGRWLPARPMGYQYYALRNFLNRLKLAWGVFTGKYDAFDWEPSESPRERIDREKKAVGVDRQYIITKLSPVGNDSIKQDENFHCRPDSAPVK